MCNARANFCRRQNHYLPQRPPLAMPTFRQRPVIARRQRRRGNLQPYRHCEAPKAPRQSSTGPTPLPHKRPTSHPIHPQHLNSRQNIRAKSHVVTRVRRPRHIGNPKVRTLPTIRARPLRAGPLCLAWVCFFRSIHGESKGLSTLQQLEYRLLVHVGLSQDRGSCLLDDLGARQLRRGLGVVSIQNTAA